MKLASRPLLTQSVTTAVRLLSADLLSLDLMPLQVLFATGDVMAQQAVERVGVEKHNFARTGRMALYGGGTLPPLDPFP